MQVLAHRAEEDELPFPEEEESHEGESGPHGRGQVFQEAEGEPHQGGETGNVEREEGEGRERRQTEHGETGQETVGQFGLRDFVVRAASEQRRSVPPRVKEDSPYDDCAYSKTGPLRINRSLLRLAITRMGNQSTSPGIETSNSDNEPTIRTSRRLRTTRRRSRRGFRTRSS